MLKTSILTRREAETKARLLSSFIDDHTRWVELFVDLFGMPNHLFV